MNSTNRYFMNIRQVGYWWSVSKENKDGSWSVARDIQPQSLFKRLRCAWDVFTGQADALYWPYEEE